MNTNSVILTPEQIAQREKLKGALKEALFWGFIVFLIVFVWKATTRS